MDILKLAASDDQVIKVELTQRVILKSHKMLANTFSIKMQICTVPQTPFFDNDKTRNKC